LEVQQRVLGLEHPETVLCLNNLGRLCYALGKYTEAEHIVTQALASSRETLGAMHPNIAAPLNILSAVNYATRAYEQAAPLLEESLHMRETMLPADHPLTAHVRRNMLLVQHKIDAR
jgi:tetratricopeptide (TPR) repeat protein